MKKEVKTTTSLGSRDDNHHTTLTHTTPHASIKKLNSQLDSSSLSHTATGSWEEGAGEAPLPLAAASRCTRVGAAHPPLAARAATTLP